MIYFIFIGGIVIGTLFTRLYMDLRSGHGRFMVVPYEDDAKDQADDGLYRVNVALKPNDDLLKKKYIILRKDNSR